ncbi:MAG: sterol desaturase family protein [Pseudomonadota bacterium]
MSALAQFLGLFVAAYAVNLVLYFGLGWGLVRLNHAHPERRLQANRDGEIRARAEILESLQSIAWTSACLALALTISLNGWGLWPAESHGLLATAIALALLIIGYDTWFYWAHRALHLDAFYRFHAWHHKSVAPTPWSADSQGAVETVMIQSFMVVATLVLPITPAALILHRLYDHINGQIGHSGHEWAGGPFTRFPSPMVAVRYHDVHHARFRYNFGNYFSIWDRVMGTMDPNYDRAEDRTPHDRHRERPRDA